MQDENKLEKIVASSLAFICTVIAGIAAYATNVFGLFDNPTLEETGFENDLSIGDFFGNGMMITASAEEVAISDEDEEIKSSILTATLSPSGALVEGINWSFAFANPNATWVINYNRKVTDYIKLEQIDDDSMSIRVICLKGFGEKIVVTASVVGYSNITANCTLEYSVRLKANASFKTTRNGTEVLSYSAINGGESFVESLGNGRERYNYLLNNVGVVSSSSGAKYTTQFSYKFGYTAGTINLPFSADCTLRISDELLAAMERRNMDTSFANYGVLDSFDITDELVANAGVSNHNINFTFDTNFFSYYFGYSVGSPDYLLLREAMAEIGNNNNDFYIDYTFSTLKQDYIIRIAVRVNENTMVEPSSMALDNNTIVF